MICAAITSSQPFAKVFGPLVPQLDVFHWLFDLQSGPFHITDKPNYEALAESLAVNVPILS